MASLIPHDIPVHPPEHPEDHEQSDVSVRALALTLAILTAIVIFSFVLVYGMFRAFDHYQASLDVKLTNVEEKADVPIDRPRLQRVPGYYDPTPADDTAAMVKAVHEHLNSEGQLENGRYHVRIDRAMQMLVESGKLKSATQPNATTGSTNAGQ